MLTFQNLNVRIQQTGDNGSWGWFSFSFVEYRVCWSSYYELTVV